MYDMEIDARPGHDTYANPLCNMPTRNRTSLGASPPLPPAPAPQLHAACCIDAAGAGTPGDGFQCNVLYDKLARARFFAWCKERAITELYVDANGDAALRNATAGAALESFVEDSDKAGIDLQVRKHTCHAPVGLACCLLSTFELHCCSDAVLLHLTMLPWPQFYGGEDAGMGTINATKATARWCLAHPHLCGAKH
eukprot:COSAG04_NODE_108_length_25934_cov_13.184014_20_plen_196_part_00